MDLPTWRVDGPCASLMICDVFPALFYILYYDTSYTTRPTIKAKQAALSFAVIFSTTKAIYAYSNAAASPNHRHDKLH